MKILCVSDTEMPQLRNAANLRRQYADIDLVISCGDMASAYLEFITSILVVPLFYVRGNHDERYGEAPPGGIDLHRRIVRYRGLTMAGLEGCMKYNDGKIQYSQRQMRGMALRLGAKGLAQRWRHGRRIDLFVTHSPARGIHDGKDLAHRGFDSFRAFMRRLRPRYMLHGHVHTWDRRRTVRTQFESTCVININPFTVLNLDPLQGQEAH